VHVPEFESPVLQERQIIDVFELTSLKVLYGRLCKQQNAHTRTKNNKRTKNKN